MYLIRTREYVSVIAIVGTSKKVDHIELVVRADDGEYRDATI